MKMVRVFQINTSKGGVPKYPVHEAAMTVDGLTGDGQADKQHHGGPERALCLFSLECILMLQEEGHPIFPGSTGENLTIAGLPWNEMKPGLRLRLGADVRIEITSFTMPCAKIKESFEDGAFSRCSHDENPGWARLYARVLSPGRVRTGDRVTTCEPGTGDA